MRAPRSRRAGLRKAMLAVLVAAGLIVPGDGGAQILQDGDNSATVNQDGSAQSGDAVAGGQIIGVVGGGDVSIVATNTSSGSSARSGDAEVSNRANVRVGPRGGYPIAGPVDCASAVGPTGGPAGVVRPGQEIRVAGEAGCARSNRPSRVALEPGGQTLGEARARADGSYESGPLAVPEDLAPGNYRVVVESAGETYVRPIRVDSTSLSDLLLVLDRLRAFAATLV